MVILSQVPTCAWSGCYVQTNMGACPGAKNKKNRCSISEDNFSSTWNPMWLKFSEVQILLRTGVRAALYHTFSTWYVWLCPSVVKTINYYLVNMINRSFMSFNEELIASQSHEQKWCLEWHNCHMIVVEVYIIWLKQGKILPRTRYSIDIVCVVLRSDIGW